MAPNSATRDSTLKGESVPSRTEVKSNEDNNDDEVEDDDEGVPIDRGWAWVIMLCFFSMNVIAVGYGKSFGVFFVEFRQEFQTSAYMTSLVPGCQSAVYCIAALLTLNVIIDLCSIRKVLLVGSVLFSLGILLAAFATNIVFLILALSFVSAVGSGTTFGPHMVLMAHYFRRRRTIATAFAYSGVSVGGVLMPLLIRYLIDEFGYRGCLLIYGGIMLHGIVFAALSRDSRSYRRKKKFQPVLPLEDDVTALTVEELSLEEAERERLKVNRRVQLDGIPRRLYVTSGSNSRSLSNLFDSISQSSVVRYASHPELLMGSRQDLGPRGFGSLTAFSLTSHDQAADVENLQGVGVKRRLCQMLDVSVLRDPMLLVLAGINVFSIVSGNVLMAFVPALAKEKGLTQVQAALLLTIAGGMDFFGRLLAGLIGDRGWMRPPRLVALYFLVLGTLNQFTFLYNSFALMVAYMAVYGLLSGAYYTLLPDIIRDYFDAQNFAKVFGIVQVFHGVASAAFYPILGALRDVTGTYEAPFHAMGACLYMSSVLLLCEPLLRRLMKQRGARRAGDVEVDVMASEPAQ